MRYEDASGAFQASGPVANDDSDILAAGSRGPATGNLITGEGTQYGSAGADSAAGAHVSAIAGKGGEDSSFAGGKLSVAGEFGHLSVDAEGNYSYMANKGAPENVRDRFTYTLADNQGNSDTAALIVEIGKTPVVIKADAQQIVPGPDGVVTLPPGVELSDIMVVGRNLVVNMPDGTQLIIVDGAVFVPQLSLGGVEVPATNVAALLIGQEPQPAAGETPPSSGGNFALPPPPLDPGVPLGDLIPPTVRDYIPPEPQETFFPEDDEPEIFVQPDGQPATVAAVDQVEEAGLPERDGNLPDEPAGSAESADGNGADNDVNSETTTGNIIYTSDDTPNVITINGVAITSVGQVFHGAFGDLTITSIAPGVIGYSYTLDDNTSGNDTHDDFAVGLTDADGDTAAATLRIDIIDDVPTARPDTDALGVGEFIATGNVMTDASLGDLGDSDTNAADTVGADNARVTFIDSVNAAPGANVPEVGFVDIAGQFGTLRIFANGDYVYTRGPNSPGGVQDVFNYTLTDGDGDTSTTTLTISIPDTPISILFGNAVSLDDDALQGGNPGGPGDDDPDTSNTEGDLNITGGDGALTFSLLTSGAPAGFTYVAGPGGSLLIQQGGVTVITVTLDPATGHYTVTQNAPIDHPSLDGQAGDNTENNLVFNVTVRVTDADGDTADAVGQIIVDDDTPIAVQAVVTGNVDEDGVLEGADDNGAGDGIAGGTGDIAGEDTVATGSVAAMFSAGADTPLSYGFAADAIAVLEGLGLTSNGLALDYAIVGNTVTASTAAGDVFTFELNANGSWEFTLIDQLDHAEGNAENDLVINLGNIIEATDADGDSVVGNANGLQITVDDDTPTASGAQVTGIVDEDGVVEGAADSGDGDGIAGGIGDVAGQDTVAIGNVSSMFNTGADAPLSFGFAANAVAVLTALGLTSGGDALDYAILGNTVTASTAAGDVFTFELNADGSWEFTLIDQLDHAPGNNENDLSINLGAIIEATDADGDSVVGNANGLVITVDDDTPVARNDVDSVPAGGDIITGNVVTGANTDTGAAGSDDTGADEPASVTGLSSNNTDDVDNDPAGGGFIVDGEFGQLTMQSDGSYSYDRFPGSPGSVADVFTYSYTDADGDTVTATLTININDSAPTLTPPPAALVDDDDVVGAGGNPGGVGDDDPANTSGNLVVVGGDGDIDFFFSGVQPSLPAGFSHNLVNASTMQILQGATVILTITLNNETGAYSIVQNNPVDHAALGNENDLGPLNVGLVAIDEGGTGDASNVVNLSITVDDDTPTVSANLAAQLDDDALAGGNPGGTGDVNPDTANLSGTLGHSFGADGAGSVVFLTTGAPAGFTYELSGSSLLVKQGATTVITVTLNTTTGAYTITQNNPIDHAAGGNENDVAFTLNYRVTDGDGDPVDGTLVINSDDDTPTVSANAAVQLDDETEAGGIAGGTGDVNPDTANTSGTLGHSFGADGAGSVVYLTSGAPAGFTYELSGSDLLIKQGTTTVITLTLNPATGQYTVTQNAPINHAAGGNENDVAFTINYRVTDGDGDTVDGTLTINSDDDTPNAAINTTGQAVSVDESVGIQVDSNDTTNAGVVALFAGVTNAGTDTDLPQYAQNASAIVNSTGSAVGADTPGTTVFSLDVSSAGVNSNLNTTAGQDILLFKEGALIVGRVSGGADDGKAAFAIAINPSTGVVSMVEYMSIQHPNAANPDDMVSIANGAVLAVVTVTDADNDTATQSVAIGSQLQFQDSGPVMTAASNINIQNSGDVAASGTFAFNLGADGANTSNDVITNVTGSATVGGVPVTNWILTPGAENATTASYSFSFNYAIGVGGTASATGTLVFDKVAGTYTVDFANPIQGVTTILQTAAGTLFQGYEFGTSNLDGSQPEISVTQIQDLAGTANDIYVQFTSVAEPSSGTGDDNLEVTNWVPGADNPPRVDGGGDNAWNAGQLFNQDDSWVSTSNDANGVAGDTIQGGEVLDFTLVKGANPTGNLAQPAAFAQASAMFLKFDGIGSGEDMIVILKLFDPNTNTYTTRAIMVENGDIQKGPGSGPGAFSGVTLDNNDGLVVIESNDYNLPGENWVIVGAQVAGSDEGVTGTAINLNSAIGAAGDSVTGGAFDTDPLGFQSDTNDGPFKISSIGFLTTQTTPQNAHLDFNVTVTDGDGDSVTQAIAVDVTPNPDTSTPIVLGGGVTTIQSVGSGDSSLSNLSFSNDNGKWGGHGNDKSFSSINNTGIVAGIVAAAGLQSAAVAGTPTFEHSIDLGLQSTVATVGLPAYQLQSIDDGSLNVQSFGVESSAPAFDFSALQGSSHSFSDFVSDGGLDIQSYIDSAPAYQPNFQGDQAPTFDASMLVASVAPAVGMPSAEALIAAGAVGVQQGGSVEQILADALSNQAPTVDGLLEAVNGGGQAAISPTIEAALHALPGGGGAGELSAILNGASPDVGAVSGWDMHSAGSFGAGFDMMFKMDVATLHQDAVQPAING